MPRRSLDLIYALLLVLGVAGVYYPVYSAGFVWLDHLEIVQGRLIVDRWSDVPGLFLQDGNFGGYHRPFYNLLHSLDRAIWGLDPFGFHLSSVLLHALNAVLVFAICRRLEFSPRQATAVGALWALHPINTASVGLIHSKADLFVATSILSMVLGLQQALSSERRLGIGIAGSAFVVALFTKELAFVVPLGLTYWAWREPRLRGFTAFTWILALGVWGLRATVAARLQHELPTGRVETLATFGTVYVDYVRRSFLPFDPSICDTVVPWSVLSTGSKLRWSVALVLLILGQVTIWRRQPALRKWIVGFHLALLPVSQFIVPTLHFRADRFLYLPTLCVIGLCVEGLELWRVQGRFQRLYAWQIPSGLFAVCVVFWVPGVPPRLENFHDDETLFTLEVSRTPTYLEGLSALAAHHDREGEFERADEFYDRCLQARANERQLSYLETRSFLVNRSFNLLAQRRSEDARRFIEQTAALVTDDEARAQLDYNLAVARYNLGDFADALPLFRDYANAHPGDARCRYLLGVSALGSGDTSLAREALEAYLQLAPNARDRAQVEAFLRTLR